jgi:nucleotide-binding universal stress UspA family protein
MFPIKTILFPVEFSQRDEAAAPFVLSMGLRYRARVILLHVLQPPPPIYAGMGAVYPDAFDWKGASEDLLVDLNRFAEAQLPKVDVECFVEPGDPATTISRFACGQGSSLIAMPTHGYGMFRRALLGSVTAKVLHDSTLPVWTSAHAPEPSHRAHPQPRRILCALDMKPESSRTLEVAMAFATDAGASIELVHVPAETVSPDAAEQHLQNMLAQAATSELVGVHEIPPIQAELGADGGSIAVALRNLALRKRSDLVVIGRGAIRSGIGRLYANSYDIIRESPCPVLSV